MADLMLSSLDHADTMQTPCRHLQTLQTVAALFVRADSVYKGLPGVDAWDIARDARRWPGGAPVVAHPPCRSWGRLKAFAKPREDEREAGVWAVEQVRTWGGVLEHPWHSELWLYCGMRAAGRCDEFGGWLLPVLQGWWGHRADKLTGLYIVGRKPGDVPPLPMRMGQAECIVGAGRSKRPEVTKAEREHTPPDLARWLVELARGCSRPGWLT